MTDSLIIVAHPEPSSFTHAWARASADALRCVGNVDVSDLCALGFDPVERAELYGADAPFDPLKVQEAAVRMSTLPADLAAEMGKIRRAQVLVFHFPIWWFGPPAILKGWFDRALVHGGLHSESERFDRGTCRGKRAVFCVSTGCSAEECGPDGREGDLRLLLWPLAQALRYCGFDIHEPVAVHGVHGYHEGADKSALEGRLEQVLQGQAALLQGLCERQMWAFNRDSDFDRQGRLKPDAPVHSPFIRHR